MCGRYTLTKSIKDIKAHFKPFRISLKHFPSFNIAPSQLSAIITHSSNKLNLVGMKWGLIPYWSKDGSIGNKLINARSETLNEKPSFRDCGKGVQRWLLPQNILNGNKCEHALFFHNCENCMFAIVRNAFSQW